MKTLLKDDMKIQKVQVKGMVEKAKNAPSKRFSPHCEDNKHPATKLLICLLPPPLKSAINPSCPV
jgi:hypothetical protein